MREEMNRREAELNEQALEGVSGGTSASRDKALNKALSLCNLCCGRSNPTGTCNQKHQTDLGKYLEAHGIDSVRLPEQCPYYTR